VKTAGSVLLTASRYCCYALVLLALCLTSARADAQSRGVRFEITQVGDTTFRFPRGTAGWVKAGSTGNAVDPRRRDILVARFRVVRVDSGMVTAVITGQTTRLATEHIAVMSEPPKSWYRGITFWAGTVFGIVIGALIAGG
jgi:hypothetical protein